MGKKKHAEHVNHERWLVSYADFITLLFAFFVVLFASSQSDKKKQAKLAAAMQSAFQYSGIFEEHAKTPPLSDESAAAPAAVPVPIAMPLPSVEEQEEQVKQIQQRIEEHLQHDLDALADGPEHQLPGHKEKFDLGVQHAFHPEQEPPGIDSVTVHRSAEGIVVSLREAGFFNSGSAELRPESITLVRAVVKSLPHEAMRVEGHTDDRPIHTAQFATNWELSTARAATVTRMLLNLHAADPNSISAAGYAEFRPTADNRTEEGRAQNRRVDIVLLNPK